MALVILLAPEETHRHGVKESASRGTRGREGRRERERERRQAQSDGSTFVSDVSREIPSFSVLSQNETKIAQ
jgi:hypothetical protein